MIFITNHADKIKFAEEVAAEALASALMEQAKKIVEPHKAALLRSNTRIDFLIEKGLKISVKLQDAPPHLEQYLLDELSSIQA